MLIINNCMESGKYTIHKPFAKTDLLPAIAIYRNRAGVDPCRPGFFRMIIKFRKVYGRYMVPCFFISICDAIP